MGETEISWTHKPGTVGRTWNPVQGCRRVSPGCEHCYAERLASRFAESGWSQGLINLKTRKWNGAARVAAHKLSEPLRWRQPSTVFVNSMSDLFYEGFSNEQIAAVFGVMAAAPQHTFQVLTKRARRMREWFRWALDRPDTAGFIVGHARSVLLDAGSDVPESSGLEHWPLPNVWLGVSVENQAAADERIPELLATPAAVRFLSCEPLLGAVVLPRHDQSMGRSYSPLDWVIAGCESGPGARPCSVESLRSLRDQCAEAGVPFFLKQATALPAGIPAPDNADPSAVTVLTNDQRWVDVVGFGDGSKRKPGGVIELPYLDGVQHAAFPEVRP